MSTKTARIDKEVHNEIIKIQLTVLIKHGKKLSVTEILRHKLGIKKIPEIDTEVN